MKMKVRPKLLFAALIGGLLLIVVVAATGAMRKAKPVPPMAQAVP